MEDGRSFSLLFIQKSMEVMTVSLSHVNLDGARFLVPSGEIGVFSGLEYNIVCCTVWSPIQPLW